MNYDDFACIALSCCGSSSEFGQIIPLVLEKIKQVIANKHLDPPEEDKTDTFLTFFIPDFLRTLLSSSSYQSSDYRDIKILLRDLLELSTKFFYDDTYKKTIFSIDTLLFTKNSALYQQNDPTSMFYTIWHSFIENSKFYFIELSHCIQDNFGQDESIFYFVFDAYKLSGKAAEFKICVENALQSYVNFLFGIDSILEKEPQRLKEFQFKALPLFIELLPELRSIQALSLLNILTNLLNSTQHKTRLLGADSIAQIARIPQFSIAISDWARQEKIKKSLLNPVSVSLCNSLSPVIQVCLKNGNIEFELFTEFINECIKQQISESTISDFISTYCDNFQVDKQPELLEKIRSVEITENNIEIFAKILSNLEYHKKEALEILIKWSENKELSNDSQKILLNYIIKIVERASSTSIPECAVDYANRLIEEEDFDNALKIYTKLVRYNICSKDVIQEFIKSDGKLRKLGFDLEIQRFSQFEEMNLKKYNDRIDDYFWYFITELIKASKFRVYNNPNMSELKQIAKEYDYSKATPSFVDFVEQLSTDSPIYLFRVVKESENPEITKIAIDKLLKRGQNLSTIIEKQVIENIDNFNESFIRIIPIVDFFFQDLTNFHKFAKANIIPHFLPKTIDVIFVLGSREEEVTVTEDETAEDLVEQASVVFKEKVNLREFWSVLDTVKNREIKEGEEIVFAKPIIELNNVVKINSIIKFINHGLTEKLLVFVNEKSDISKSDMEKIFSLINKLPTSQDIKDALKEKDKTLELLETAKNIYYVKYIFESIRNLSQCSKDYLLKDDKEILHKIIKFLEMESPAEFKEEIINILKQYLEAEFVTKSDIHFILPNLIDIFVDETCSNDMRFNIIEIIQNLSYGELQQEITEIMKQKTEFLNLILQNLTKDNFEQFKEFVDKCDILPVIFEIVRSQISKENFDNKFILSLIEEKSEIGKYFSEKEFLEMSINLITLQNPEMVKFGVDFFYKLADKSEIVNEYVTFLINLILTTDNEDNKENIFKLFWKISEINEVYKTAFVTFVDDLVNLRIERFNYDYHLFNQSSTKSVGLLNLGSTCFFNAVIQQLFHLPCFTYIILTEKFENDISMHHLQRMLSELLISKQRYSDPKSFFDEWKGWNSQKINVKEQQDASEFMTIFIDKLPPDISKLFKGSSVWTVRDLEGNILKRIEEDFTTISLQVRSFSNMNSSLNGFAKPGMLTGDNQYESDGQKIDAQHLTRLKVCPPILFFQLRRFEYNTRTGTRDKINDKFDISLKIKIDPLLETNEKQNYYLLNGIIMHSGGADSGHYLSYVKIQNNWIEFNDSEVSFIDQETVLEKAAAKGTLENCSAYILVYVKENFIQTDDNDEMVTFNDLEKYIPKDMKEEIYKMNEIFMKTQFAFSRIFLNYMMNDDNSGFDKKLNFFFHIFLHADYKEFPTRFFDKMIRQSSFNDSNLKLVISEHTDDVIELYLSLTNTDIVSKLNVFISSLSVQLTDDDKLFEFYQTVVDRLELFVENRMNVKNILKLIYDFSFNQKEKCQVFVDKIQEFIVLNYEKAEQMALTYKSNLFIGDVFNILSLYLDSVKIEILLKYSDMIIMTYSNRHPFYNLLVLLYENDKIDDEFCLETARANPSAMFSEFRKKFDTMKIEKSIIIVTFYERFHSLRDEILKFLITKDSINYVQSCRLLSKLLISLLFANKEEDRKSARNIIEIGFPVMRNDDILENYSENDDFLDFVDEFLKYFVKFANSEEKKDEKVMKDVLNYIVILCPFMREEEDLAIVSLITNSSEQNEIFNYLMFCSLLGSDFAEKYFTQIMEIVMNKIPHYDENRVSDETTSVLAALTCFAMNLDYNSDEIKNFLSQEVMKLFKNVMKTHGKDTSEYLFLETAYNEIENSKSEK